MDIKLFIKEGIALKVLSVPPYVVKNLLRDKLSQSELDRIHRLASPVKAPENFKPGSVIVDFSNKSAECFDSKINIVDLEPTWKVQDQALTLDNY